jgi:hypothetical protein
MTITRLYTFGAESNGGGGGLSEGAAVGFGNLTVQAGGIGGGYLFRAYQGGALAFPVNGYQFRGAMWANSQGLGGYGWQPRLIGFSTAGALIAYVNLQNVVDHQVYFYKGSILASAPLAYTDWHHFGFDCNFVNPGWFKLWIDGVLTLNVTGDLSLTGPLLQVDMGASNQSWGYFDHGYLDSSAGEATDAGPLLDIRQIGVMTIDGQGDRAELTNSNNDKLNNYQKVDDVPFNAADYCEAQVLGEGDLYTLSAAPAVPQGFVVRGITQYWHAFKTNAVVDSKGVGLVKLDGVTHESSEKGLTATGNFFQEHLAVKPNGSAWATDGSDLAALQVGFEGRGTF